LFLAFNWGDSIFQFYFRYPFYVALIGLFALVTLPDYASKHEQTKETDARSRLRTRL
jgi:hypothetical protein